jgi:DNA polymerase-3 subunit beta
LRITSNNAETGEQTEVLETDYAGYTIEIGFNAQYLQEFLNVICDLTIAVDLKDFNSQAQLRPNENASYDYKYIVMPMRI